MFPEISFESPKDSYPNIFDFPAVQSQLTVTYISDDLQKKNARGKSGPLFTFDVHDDVRLVNDASVEKEESHAGKVLLRSWYERNKHIFPASRWEPYDPTKSYDKYTVSDRSNKK
ncbi:hypothetical protein ANN_21530 [Periplaneta americana]|uniref:Protein FAM50 homolog n=1 Tax=Periplaneta americana TaxID=6978 RepID=A0ABQ8SGR4_PERAM|nr:hypothetical protein ANN_21530 [Periplaneta americana]